MVYATCHVSLSVRKKVKKKKQYNSSRCELGPPVGKLAKKDLKPEMLLPVVSVLVILSVIVKDTHFRIK